MPEPTTTTATLAAAPAAVSAVTIAGVSLGLNPAVLVAGFSGALVAIVLLASVPDDGNHWIVTTIKRMFVSLASSLTAGYLTPLFLLPIATPNDAVVMGTAFAIGGGAQKFLRVAIARTLPSTEEKEGEHK